MMLRQVHNSLEKNNCHMKYECWWLHFPGRRQFWTTVTPGHCCMMSSNDDVMYIRAHCVILTILTNQKMVVTYSVYLWCNSVVYLRRYATSFRTFWSTHVLKRKWYLFIYFSHLTYSYTFTFFFFSKNDTPLIYFWSEKHTHSYTWRP